MRIRLAPPREPGLAQQHARLNGLAEAHLIGDQKFGRPIVVKALKGLHLVGPGCDCRCCFADALAPFRQRGRMLNEGPETASQIAGWVLCPYFRFFRRRLPP